MKLVYYSCYIDYAFELVHYLGCNDAQIDAAQMYEKYELIAYCMEQAPDVLLVDKEIADRDILALRAGTRILMMDEDSCTGSSGPEDTDDPAADWPRISRYLPADEIRSQIYLLKKAAGMPAGTEHFGEGAQITVFYAPSGYAQSEDAAWNYAKESGDAGSVLYLNLHENAGFEAYFHREYRRDLSDLLYLDLHYDNLFSDLIRSVSVLDDGVTYIPPADAASDVFALSEKEWCTFWQHLKYACGYERIVVDLQYLFPGAYALLELCDRICLMEGPSGRDPCSQQHFLQLYRKRFGDDACAKLVQLQRRESLPGRETGS